MAGRRREGVPARVQEIPKVTLTATAWAACSELGLQEWAEQGRRLGTIGRGIGWWIGDWLGYGNLRFGERYARAARITGYDTQTLMNMVYVASRFDASQRRAGLSFSHHAEVAALDPEAQAHWLTHAQAERLSVRCLREELRRDGRRLRAAERPALDPVPAAGHELVCPECGCSLDGVARAAVVS